MLEVQAVLDVADFHLHNAVVSKQPVGGWGSLAMSLMNSRKSMGPGTLPPGMPRAYWVQSHYSNHPRAHTSCYLGAVDHPKKFPLPLVTLQARSYCTHQATQTLLFAKPFDLTQVCHGNEICSKLVLTCKLTLELSFPAHCISNWKLNGISWTNIRKVTLNVANELPTLQSGPVVRDGPPAGPGGGGKCAVEHESMVQKAPSVWSPYGCRQWLWDLWDRKVLYPGDELVIQFKVLEFAKEAVVWLLCLKILHRSELDPAIFLTFQNHVHQIDLFISLRWQGPEL